MAVMDPNTRVWFWTLSGPGDRSRLLIDRLEFNSERAWPSVQVTLHALFRGPTSEICPGPEGLFRGTKSVVAGKFPRCGPEPTEPCFSFFLFSFLLCWALLLAYMLFFSFYPFGINFPFFTSTHSIGIRVSPLFNQSLYKMSRNS